MRTRGGREYLADLKAQVEREKIDADRAALNALIGYVEANVTRMNYPQRLQRGLPIGSGAVEGTNKTIVGRRLRINYARWNIPSVEQIGGLCCVRYSNTWEAYWDQASA